MHPKSDHVNRLISSFWCELSRLQGFIGKFRFFSEPWFGLHFLPKDWNQRIHRAPDHGRAHARHAPKEVDDAL